MTRLGRTLMAVSAAVVLAACGEDENGAPPPDEAPAETEATATDPVPPEHGETYFGVYLATGQGPDLEDAINYLTEERGLEPGQEFTIGDVSCDRGAQEALGPDAGPMRVAVYFESEDEAEAWAETLPAAPITIAEVQTMCLD